MNRTLKTNKGSIIFPLFPCGNFYDILELIYDCFLKIYGNDSQGLPNFEKMPKIYFIGENAKETLEFSSIFVEYLNPKLKYTHRVLDYVPSEVSYDYYSDRGDRDRSGREKKRKRREPKVEYPFRFRDFLEKGILVLSKDWGHDFTWKAFPGARNTREDLKHGSRNPLSNPSVLFCKLRTPGPLKKS